MKRRVRLQTHSSCEDQTRVSPRVCPPPRTLHFVLDDTLISAKGDGNRRKSQTIELERVNPKPHLTGKGVKLTLWVSPVNPVDIEQYQIELSPDPVPYPDGSKYHELIVIDKTSGEVTRFPANESTRTFGRFTLTSEIQEPAVAVLGVTASNDYSLHGGDTLTTTIAVADVSTYGELFDALGKQYGFTVEWTVAPGEASTSAPQDLIRAMREVPLDGIKNRLGSLADALSPGYVVGEWLTYEFPKFSIVSRMFTFDWVNSKQLKVSMPKIAEYLEQQNEEKTRDTEREHMDQMAKRDYKQSVQVYPLKKLSAETARSLAYPELKKYGLGPKRQYPNGVVVEAGPKYWDIVAYALDDKSPDLVWSSVETADADSRANALFVNAIPQTHKRIKELLDKMDGMLGAEETTTTGKRYRIEVILLQGGTHAKGADASVVGPMIDPSTGMPVSLRQSESLLNEAEVRYRHAKSEAEQTRELTRVGKAPPE